MSATEQNVIDLLHETFTKPLSEEDFASRLAMTPAQLRKLLQTLTKKGVKVDANRDGKMILKLLPDALNAKDIQAHLKTNFIGHDVHYFKTLDSDLVTAFNLAERYPSPEESMTPLRKMNHPPCQEGHAFAGNGSVVITEVASQECTIWSNQVEGINLNAAVVLRPGILPTRAPQIALVAAVSLARVIEQMVGIRLSLRWPLELLVKGKTVAKIKVKTKSNVDIINFLILGFEVNINGLADELDESLGQAVTSLRSISGKWVNRPLFAASLFRELEKWYVTYINKGPEKIIREMSHLFRFDKNQTVIESSGKTYAGMIDGLEPDGTILLKSATGEILRFSADHIAQRS